MPTPTPIELADARAKGQSHYFTGKPCKNGHISPRSTNKNRCLECMREWQREARKREPEAFARKSRKKLYGLIENEYQRMLTDHGGLCGICRAPFSDRGPFVDHDHVTGKIRGLLCHHCNLMLGHARDNVETLTRAITYLKP